MLIQSQDNPDVFHRCCFLLLYLIGLTCSATSDIVVSLQWSPSFTSQHAVERYSVVVTPDSSCSSERVSPSEDYACSEVLGAHYSFTISAINCGNQEGSRENITVQPQGELN